MIREEDFDQLAKELFPLCRSLTGEGVRQSFSLLEKHIPLKRHTIDSGESVFDWTIPKEWNVKDAYIIDPSGEKIVDFQENNLHLLGYSMPVNKVLPLEELQDHLYSLPEQPEAIPYVTSYYKERWGFCLTHHQREQLKTGDYQVVIDSSLREGKMDYADLIIPGSEKKEILISTYICHPSMGNNELSGPLIATFLAKTLLSKKNLKYTYRFVFVPETIGAIAYISRHLDELKQKTLLGYVITCAGDPGQFSYLNSKYGHSLVDRISKRVLTEQGILFKSYSYMERGSDERQYSSFGVDIPVGSIMRSKYREYPEYHTSLDDLNFISSKAMLETLNVYIKCIEELEGMEFFRCLKPCEPKLDKYGLYETVGKKDNRDRSMDILNVLAYCDGQHDLRELAELIKLNIQETSGIVDDLLKHKLIEKSPVPYGKNQ